MPKLKNRNFRLTEESLQWLLRASRPANTQLGQDLRLLRIIYDLAQEKPETPIGQVIEMAERLAG